MCGPCSLVPAFQSLGTLPTNPDSVLPNPEHQPGGHASLWVGQQALYYVPGAGAALAPRQAVCTPGGKLSSKQEWQAEKGSRRWGGGAVLTLHTQEEAGAPPTHPALFSQPSLLSLPAAPGRVPAPGLRGPRALRLPLAPGPGSRRRVGWGSGAPCREGAHWEGLDGPRDLTVLGHPLDAPHWPS